MMIYSLDKTIRVVNRMVFDPKQFSQEQTDMLLSGVGCELQLEPVSLEDVEHTYLVNALVEEEHLLSAIMTKRNRLERTMRALVKSLNASLTGTDLTAGAESEDAETGAKIVGNAIVSKPRKAGQYAVITAQIPVSDGQSVSVVFYAPDDDPLKIARDDTLIAFRFLLNKRDITHIVAPTNGKDISLRQTTMALSNALEKNSVKFSANQAKVTQEKATIESLGTELESTIDEADKVADSIETQGIDGAVVDSKNDKMQTKLDRLVATNQQLENEISTFSADNKTLDEQNSETGMGTFTQAKKDLVDLLAGRIKPSSIVGTGYKNAKQVAAGYLHKQMYNESSPDNIDHVQVKANGEAYDTEAQAMATKYYKKLGAGTVDLISDNLEVGDFGIAETYGGYMNPGYMIFTKYKKVGDTPEPAPEPEPTPEPLTSEQIVSALFKDPALTEALKAVKNNGNSDILGSLVTIAQIDAGGAQGSDRSLFVSSLAGKVKTLSKNGRQKEVNNVLAMLSAYNLVAKKPAITTRNAIWSLGQTIEETPNAGAEYDPENEYDFENSIAGIIKYAKENGVEVGTIDRDGADFEGNFEDTSVGRVPLKKNDSDIVFQVVGDGKMAVFSEQGERLSSFNGYSFTEFYSNDSDTLQERIQAFSAGVDALTAEPVTGGTIDNPFAAAYAANPVESATRYAGTEITWKNKINGNSFTGTIKQIRSGGETFVVTSEGSGASESTVDFEDVTAVGELVDNRQGMPAFDKVDSDIEGKLDDAQRFFGGANFWYGLRARPYGPGATPSGQSAILDVEQAQRMFSNLKDNKNIRHGAMAFAEALTAEQVSQFELIPLDREGGKEQGDKLTNWEAAFPDTIADMIKKAEDMGFPMQFNPSDEEDDPNIYADGTTYYLDNEEDLVSLSNAARKWIADNTPGDEPANTTGELEQHLITLKSISNSEMDLSDATAQLEVIGEYIEANNLESEYESELTEAINAVTAMIQTAMAKVA